MNSLDLPAGWVGMDEWFRDTRGRSWDFDLPTAQIVDALETVASALGDHFDLFACKSVQGPEKWYMVYEVQPVSSLVFGGEWPTYFVRSHSLSPVLPSHDLTRQVRWDALFATNGLVILMHPLSMRDKSSVSHLSLVNRVRSKATGEVLDHSGYDAVFRRLKRELGKRMKELPGSIS